MRCLSTGLGVALGWLWVALCSLLSDFSFQLAAQVPSHASRITHRASLPARSLQLRQRLAQGRRVTAGGAFGLQVLEMRMRENRRLHTCRARRFIEVLHCARRSSNRTVHFLHVPTQLGLIPVGPVFAFVVELHPAAQTPRGLHQADR